MTGGQMDYKVIVATRQSESEPWDFSKPVAEFVDPVRAVRFAKSEIKDGWAKERVRVVCRRRTIWPEA